MCVHVCMCFSKTLQLAVCTCTHVQFCECLYMYVTMYRHVQCILAYENNKYLYIWKGKRNSFTQERNKYCIILYMYNMYNFLQYSLFIYYFHIRVLYTFFPTQLSFSLCWLVVRRVPWPRVKWCFCPSSLSSSQCSWLSSIHGYVIHRLLTAHTCIPLYNNVHVHVQMYSRGGQLA